MATATTTPNDPYAFMEALAILAGLPPHISRNLITIEAKAAVGERPTAIVEYAPESPG